MKRVTLAVPVLQGAVGWIAAAPQAAQLIRFCELSE